MSKANYAMAFNKVDSELKGEDGDENVPVYEDGKPFWTYKNARFTDNYSSEAAIKLQQGLPTNSIASNNALQQNAIRQGNQALVNWNFSTQTLGKPSFSTISCTSNVDCEPYGPEYKCNLNFQPWSDAYGNSPGPVCSYTMYPEIDSGSYQRLDANHGGIGKACKVDSDCGAGYECNNTTDPFGKNVQQTGYCAQPYVCSDGIKRPLGYPYNSSIPIPPDPSQNKYGAGYPSLEACEEVCKGDMRTAQQDCKKLGNAWFIVYPGYCPVDKAQRSGGKGASALAYSTSSEVKKGFSIPSFANIGASTDNSEIGAIGTNAFSGAGSGAKKSQNMLVNSDPGLEGLSEATRYMMKINGQI
jgi:hypothetical protein